MKNNNKENKNKRKALIVSIISGLTIIGGTLAYFTTSSSVKNSFKTALYQHTIEERFESPDNWTPGTTTEKAVKVTNTGSVPMAVRASFTEKWTSKNGDELPLKDSKNNVVAIINFNNSWTKDADGYYYYGSKANKQKLMSEQTTTSFIDSVTFNENITADLNSSVSSDGQTITITSSGNGYDDAKYTLTITIDTIQYDQANNVW